MMEGLPKFPWPGGTGTGTRGRYALECSGRFSPKFADFIF